MRVVSAQKVIVFEQLGLERVTQRAGYIGLHVVSGDLNIDGGAVKGARGTAADRVGSGCSVPEVAHPAVGAEFREHVGR
jgi:hypothetical protein